MRLSLFFSLILSCVTLRAENWPRFRGPTGQGISTEKGLPLHWSASSNVVWKTEIPGEGWSSPIIWEDRIFLTTVTDNNTTCRMLCVNRLTGKMLWNRPIFDHIPKRKESKNSYATPTPVTDGKLVCAVFGDGSMAALAHDGQILWTNREVQFYSQHGLGASPILYQDLLIMPFDGSNEGEDKKLGWQTPWDQAFILGLDKTSGKPRWKAKRGRSRIAHVTPNVLSRNGASQLISPAGDVVQGFDLNTGTQMWSVYAQGEGVVPSVAIGDGLIFAASGFEKTTLRAIRAGGTGDVTRTHIAWEQTKGVPTLPSLLYVSPFLYAITEGGIATCYKGETGEIVWQERVGGNHSASPVFAEGKIYFLSENGETTIIESGADYKVVAKNSINERCQASLALSQKQLFIRSAKNLFCIEQANK